MSTKISNKGGKVIAVTFIVLMITSLYVSTAYAQYGGGGSRGSFRIIDASVQELSGENPEHTMDLCGIIKIVYHLTSDSSFTSTALCITPPTGIPQAPSVPIQYYRISVPASVKPLIEEVEIHLRLPKTDLENMGVGINSLQLYRFNEVTNNWEELLTEKVGEDASYVYYIARTRSLSFFALVGEKAEEIPITEEPFSGTFTVEGFNVGVTLTSGEVTSIDANIEEKMLMIMLANVEEDAELIIEIPRELLDSKNPDGSDKMFGILIDGILTSASETTRDGKRVLTINVPANTNEISIIGTHIVPEFGIVAIMILAASMAGIIIAMRSKINYKL